jgi:hypothetical protein
MTVIEGAVVAGIVSAAGLGLAQLPPVQAAAAAGERIAGMPPTAILATALILSLGLLWWLVRFGLIKLVDLIREAVTALQETRDVMRELREAIKHCQK